MGSERNTLVGTPVVIAPGKLFLIGEYAVLEDGPAVLAAVNQTLAQAHSPIAEGDEVAFFPPVTGG